MKNEEIRDWNSFFQILNPDNTMSFNRYIAHAIGITETIIYFSLISKMMYHMKNNRLDSDGFFYATVGDIQESTTVKKEKQIAAIKRLVEIGLIETKIAGIPARKYFRIVKNLDLLLQLIAKGETVAQNIKNEYRSRMRKSHKADCNQVSENTTASKSSEKVDNNQVSENTTASYKDVPTASYNDVPTASYKDVPTAIYKTKENKPNSDNPNFYQSSIGSFAANEDKIDGFDENSVLAERAGYEELIKENIDYDTLRGNYKLEKRFSRIERLDEIVAIMTDVVCSTSPTVKINGNNTPHEVVKSTFLKINDGHIEYVLDALEQTTSEIRNIRAYLITTLYNSIQTMGSYYQMQYNVDFI